MANQKQPLLLVELMRFFTNDTVAVRFAVLASLLCTEIVLRLAVLLTKVGLVAAVSYGLKIGFTHITK